MVERYENTSKEIMNMIWFYAVNACKNVNCFRLFFFFVIVIVLIIVIFDLFK